MTTEMPTALPREGLQPFSEKSLAERLNAAEPLLPFIGMLGFLFVIIGVFLPFARFPVAGFPTWFGGGAGSGIPILIFAVLGGLAFASKVFSVPLVLCHMCGFLLAMDILTSYDTSAIMKNTVLIPTAEFRLVYDIFLDAFRIGNGAFFALIGLALVFFVCAMEFFRRVLNEGNETA